jgi:acetolactate synthase-1/2/3 large subunit
MNGAESLLRTLVNAGVDTCFTNPGTSEMQFVAAVDRVDGMRCVLGLFEGVVSGAADGYGRMLGKPAMSLIHLGPGLANGLANFHNAKKARSPIINVVGEHASYHRDLNPPLASDIEAFARPVSNWITTVNSADEISSRTHDAVVASMQPPGQIATLIVPADYSWLDAEAPVSQIVPGPTYTTIDDDYILQIAAALKSGEPCALLMRSPALQDECLNLAGKIASNTGAKLFSDTFAGRKQRGAGRVPVEILPYFSGQAIQVLSGIKHLILVDSVPPVGFFAYPNEPNELTPEGAKTWKLSEAGQNTQLALSKLVDALDANNENPVQLSLDRPDAGSGSLNPDSIAQSLGAYMPENAIIIDEAISSGLSLADFTHGAPPHDWLDITGGSIGQGLPLATGTAVACPDRRTICLQADGSGMYTLQALWTHARESLNVTTVIYANRSYKILNIEHERVGAGAPGAKADSMMSLQNPELDWVKLARGMGVTAERVTDIDEFNRLFQGFLNEDGPNLIEAVF